MTSHSSIFGFYIFNRRTCLYKKVWNPSLKAQDTLLHGLLFSLKRFCAKIGEPHRAEAASEGSESSQANGAAEAVTKLQVGFAPFESLSTTSFKLHFFESLTGLKFVFITQPQLASLRAALKDIYEGLYVPLVILVPRAKLPLSDARLSSLILTSSFPHSLQKFVNKLQED